MFVYKNDNPVESARLNLPKVNCTDLVVGSPKEETRKSLLSRSTVVDENLAVVGGVPVADCESPVEPTIEKTKLYLNTEATNEAAIETFRDVTIATVIGFPIDGEPVDNTLKSRKGGNPSPHDVVVFTAIKDSTDPLKAPHVVCHDKGMVDHTNRLTNKEEHIAPHNESTNVEGVLSYDTDKKLNAHEGRTLAETPVK